MAIIKQTNKKTGVTYVYDSHSYWDKEKKQHRSDRKLIGKIDPEPEKLYLQERRKKIRRPMRNRLLRSKHLKHRLPEKMKNFRLCAIK